MRGRLPLRLRVASVFAAVAAIALVALGLFVYYGVDATLAAQARTSLEAQADALTALPDAGRDATIAAMTGEFFAQVLTPSGAVVASSPQLGPEAASDGLHPPDGEDVVVEQPVYLVEEGGTEAAVVLARQDRGQVVLVGTSREDLDDALRGVRTQLLVGGPLALLLASAAGYVAAGAALRPMEAMRRHAEAISAQSAGERLPLPPARDEARRLGHTLNQMLDRLDAGLQRERRFVAEASHELRTPLAMLKLELDLALAQPRESDKLVAALRSAGEEVDHLTRLSDDLLLLASSERPGTPTDAGGVQTEVRSALDAVARRFAARAHEDGRSVRAGGEDGLVVRANPGRVERVLSNLVDNALRHGAGDVDISSRWVDGRVALQVSDEGPGIHGMLHDHVLEAFSRSPAARGHGSSGLGLAIVQALVTEMKGTVAIDNRADGHGLVVTVTVPGHRRVQH